VKIHEIEGTTAQPRSVSVDLQNDTSLQVEISDAVSERDKVKFTVHTKTTLSHFKKTEFSVVRQHEEFIWLHDVYTENEDYAGIIIPPAPPKPDFEASREKLQKLGEGDGSMTREEFAKMKQELEAREIAFLRKNFIDLCVCLSKKPLYPAHMRISFHSCFSTEGGGVSDSGKSKKVLLLFTFKKKKKKKKKKKLSGLHGLGAPSLDFSRSRLCLLLTQKYILRIPETGTEAFFFSGSGKAVALLFREPTTYTPVSNILGISYCSEPPRSCLCFPSNTEIFMSSRQLEWTLRWRVDLKLEQGDARVQRRHQEQKDLLYRRLRALADYENANKALDKARMKNKEVKQAEAHQQLCCQKFEKISESAKQELTDFKVRRVAAFRKNLIELTELELKHAKASSLLLRNSLIAFKDDQ
uniref:Sorting nexin 32 n=1 Tax=Latimeria chalumnae TaxID=7897 RepID=H3AUS7_LATCH